MLRILVVDDDPSFGRLLARYAIQLRVNVAHFTSVDEVKGKLAKGKFTGAILDYDLGKTTGIELSRYLERYIRDLPIILVSQSAEDVVPPDEWPPSVKKFIPKREGHQAIMDSLLEVLEAPRP